MVPEEIDVPTHGFVLRRWCAHDAPRLLAAIEQSLPELRPFMPWAAETPTLASVGAYLEQAGVGGPDIGFGIVEAGGEVVGSCGLHDRRGPGILEIGYWVRSDRTGRGYATATAGALTAVALECFPEVDRVEIRCDPANVASAAIPRKLGYRRDAAQAGENQVWAVSRSDYYLSTDR